MVTLRSKNVRASTSEKFPSPAAKWQFQKIHRIKNDERSARISLSFFSCKWGNSGSRYWKTVGLGFYLSTARVVKSNLPKDRKRGRENGVWWVHLTFKNARSKSHSSHPSWGERGHTYMIHSLKILEKCFEFKLFQKHLKTLTEKRNDLHAGQAS